MPTYKIKDPSSGKTVTLKGDAPPTESELTEIFSKVGATESAPSNTKANVMAVVRPTMEAGGAIAGGVIGQGAVPIPGVGMAAGGALGYAAGKTGADLVERGLGTMEKIKSGAQAATETMDAIKSGMISEIGGNLAGRAAQTVIKKGSPAAKAAYEKAKEWGVKLTPAEATRSRLLSSVEAVLAKTPFSSGMISRFRARQAEQLEQAANGLIETLGSTEAPQTVGQGAQQAIEQKMFKRLAAKDQLFDRLTKHIHPGKLVDTQNVKETAEMLLQKEAQLPAGDRNPEIVKYLESKIRDAQVGLSFDGFKGFRERLNQKIGDMADNSIKQIHKALKKAADMDMAAFTEREGGALESSWKKANKVHGAVKELYDDPNIRSIMDKANPSAIVNSLMNSKNTLQLTLLRKAMPEKAFQNVQKAMVTRLFEGGVNQTPGQALNSNLKKYGEEYLEKAVTAKTLARLKEFAKVADAAQHAEKVAGNPSGTAQTLITAALGAGFVISNPVTATKIIIAPPVMAKIYLSEFGKNLITKGLKMNINQNTARAAGIATSIAALAAKEQSDKTK